MKSPIKVVAKALVRSVSATRPRRHAAHDDSFKGRVAATLARFRDRMARSRRVFLLGVVIACAIEVVIDWNSTLLEINNLRDRMHERGTSYVAILDKSASAPLVARDRAEIERLSAGLFDDQDVVFVRYVDRDAKVFFERLDPVYAAAFAKRRGAAFTDYFAHQLDRDMSGILHDPDGLVARMTNSRHRDFVQGWNDFVSGVVARFVTPKPVRAASGLVLYQDRLYTTAREHDGEATYALATINDATRAPVGVVLVAFSMDRTNAAIRGKLWKGAGLIAFFVGLLVIQNILARRDKLKLLEQETRHHDARDAILAALPPSDDRVGGALDQTDHGVDGMIWSARKSGDVIEILFVDPLGNDVVSGAIALHVAAVHRALDGHASIDDVLLAVAAAARAIPLGRPIGAFVVRLDRANGEVVGRGTKMLAARASGGALAFEDASAGDATILGPWSALRGTLDDGAVLAILCDGIEPRTITIDREATLDFFGRATGSLAERADDAVTWARGRWSSSSRHDLALVALARIG